VDAARPASTYDHVIIRVILFSLDADSQEVVSRSRIGPLLTIVGILEDPCFSTIDTNTMSARPVRKLNHRWFKFHWASKILSAERGLALGAKPSKAIACARELGLGPQVGRTRESCAWQ